MNYIQQLEERIKSEGILQISWAVFEDHEVNVLNRRVTRKANSTPQHYCETVGKHHNLTAEEYAKEMLAMMDAPKTEIVGECPDCYAMLGKDEEHTCT